MTTIADLSLAWLQAALTRLNGDPTLQTMVTGAYVHPPEATSPSYLLLSSPRLQARHARGIMVVQGEAVVTLWSPSPAVELAHSIMARMQQVLIGSSRLSIAPHHLVSMRVLELQIQRTQQRDLCASIMRVNLWIEGV